MLTLLSPLKLISENSPSTLLSTLFCGEKYKSSEIFRFPKFCSEFFGTIVSFGTGRFFDARSTILGMFVFSAGVTGPRVSKHWHPSASARGVSGGQTWTMLASLRGQTFTIIRQTNSFIERSIEAITRSTTATVTVTVTSGDDARGTPCARSRLQSPKLDPPAAARHSG
jgi:hypothetical protein